MEDLDEIITKMDLEVKRALAIKMIKEGYLMEDICTTLSVTKSFIEKWRSIYNKEGAKDLKPKYKGSVSFLKKEELNDVCTHIKTKETFRVEELISYVREEYGVVYKSKQSYYDILTTAGMSWKKTEKINPKKDENKVAEKKEEIKKNSKKIETKYFQEIWSF
jgi:putative transposase